MLSLTLTKRFCVSCSFVAIFFSFWVVFYPATWLAGFPRYIPKFAAADAAAISRFDPWPSIRLLHCAAGALWTVTLPIQLSSHVRRKHPKVHRVCGRLFFVGAAAVTAGYIIMELGHKQVLEDHGIHRATFYRPLAYWFAFTAVQAVLAALKRDYMRHAIYSIRHIGPGLTFGLARLLILLAGASLHFTGLMDMTLHHNKMKVFYVCSYTAALASVGGCEWVAAAALRKQHQQLKQ